MTRFPVVASVLMFSLAVPAMALAQAGRRGGGDSDGSAGGRTSSEPSVGTAVPRGESQAPPSMPSAPSGGDRSPAPASVRVTGSNTPSNARTGGTVARGPVASRARDERVARGTAQPRTNLAPRDRPLTVVYPTYYYSSYDPWYSSRYGYFGLYSPWYYGAGGWGWGGYGSRYWHDPFLYGPSYYGSRPYYWNGPQYDIPGSAREERDDPPTGSLRLKVSPRHARVYVDGALAGVVDEFDGLKDHLELPVGRHQIEFRAEGFETRSLEVVVEKGKTRTERVTLKLP